MQQTAADTYDEIPYGDYAFAATHPDRLASVAALYGLDPPPVESCRVLEIGCAVGGNLIPMALTLPGSRFVGIDVSPRQIEVGRARVAALGLSNVELRVEDILDFSADAGPFDYVVCHGVYSWVPAVVQDRIMQVCSSHLSPHGVAYISYNTLPGWHIRGMVRDLLNYQSRRFADSRERLAHARGMLDFVSRTFAPWDTLYANLMKLEVRELLEASDDYFFHEHLEEFNEPIYFSEFVRRCERHGLRFVAEADFLPGEQRIAPDVLQEVYEITPDQVHFEQLRDFLIARMFRKSLLCRQDAPVCELPRAASLLSLRMTGNLRPTVPNPDLVSDAAVEFLTPEGATVATNHPLTKTALYVLAAAAPRSLTFEELWSRLLGVLEPRGLRDGPEQRGEAARLLLRCYLGGMIGLHRCEPPLTAEVGERPCASPVARAQAAREMEKVINLRHKGVELSPFERLLIQQLDGRRDQSGLLQSLLQLADAHVFAIEHGGQPLTDRTQLEAVLRENLRAALVRFAQHALLLHDGARE